MTGISNSELCNRNGVAIFRVGEVYECDESGEPIPKRDLAKWFVSVPDDGQFAHLVKTIPLSDTYEHAEALAVDHLGLLEKACPECGAAVRIYSQRRRSVFEIIVPVALLGVLVGVFNVSLGQHKLAVAVLAPVVIWMIWQVGGRNRTSSVFCAACGYSE